MERIETALKKDEYRDENQRSCFSNFLLDISRKVQIALEAGLV
jgi:hypothetical protein